MLHRVTLPLLLLVALLIASCLRDYEDYGYSDEVGEGGATGASEDCQNDGDCFGPSVCRAGRCI